MFACQHETALLSLHEFSWNSIFEDFSNISRRNSESIKTVTRIKGTLHKYMYINGNTSLCFFSKTRNLRTWCRAKSKHTLYVEKKNSPENHVLYDIKFSPENYVVYDITFSHHALYDIKFSPENHAIYEKIFPRETRHLWQNFPQRITPFMT